MATFDLLRSALIGPWGPKLMPQTLRMELLRLRFDGSFVWQAQKRLMEAGLHLSLRAYTGPAPCIYTSLFTPPELAHGLGLVPFNLEAAGGVAASLGIAGHTLRLAERAWLPSDACTVLRSAVGGIHAGLLPRPAALVCTTTACDSTAQAFAAAARHLDAPLFLLDIPYHSGAGQEGGSGIRYLAAQMDSLAGELARLTGRRLETERLAQAIRLSNQARSYLAGIQELRREFPGLLPASDALAFLYPTSLLMGSEDGVAVFRSFYEEMSSLCSSEHSDFRSRPTAAPGKTKGTQGPVPSPWEGEGRGEGRATAGLGFPLIPVPSPWQGEGDETEMASGPLRILWLHLLPYYPHRLLEHLSRAGAEVVFEEMSEVYWAEMDPAVPYVSLARKCIDNPWNGPLARRIAALRRLVRQYGIEGAVHFSHWGCRQSAGALSVLSKALREEGVPLLALDGDVVDARCYGEGQCRTRLEGFAEMLQVRRRGGA